MSKYKHAYLNDFIEEHYLKSKEQLIDELQEKDPILLKETIHLLKKQIDAHQTQCMIYEALAAGIVRAALKLERPAKVTAEFIRMGNNFDNYNLSAFPLNTVENELKRATTLLVGEVRLFHQKAAFYEVINSFRKPKTTCCVLSFWNRNAKANNDIKETPKPSLSI